MKKKLKEEEKMKRKEAKRERREKKKREKMRSSSSEDSSDLDNPRKNRKHGHESDADGNAGDKDRRTQIISRNLSRTPSRSPTRNPVRRDHDSGRSRRDDLDSRSAFKREGRQWDYSDSDVRSKEFENRDPENRKRAPSRSPSRSPVRRNYDISMSRRGDHRSASQSEGSKREYSNRDRMLKGSEDRDYDKKRVVTRSPSRSPIRRSSVRRGRDQQLKGSEDRGYDKRKRVPSRSPNRSPVRRDYDHSRSRRDDLDFRGTFRGEGRQWEQKGSDQRLKGSEDREYEKKRRISRSLSRSLSRSPVRRRDYGQNRSRRDDLDPRGALKSEGRNREHDFSDQRLKEPDYQDSGPCDTREQERIPRSSNDGSADDLRISDSVVREKKLDAEGGVAGRKDTNDTTVGVPSRPMNRGRPPKPGQLSDAERAARLAEMQANADVHEEQRWQRLKRAADADAVEVKRSEKDKSNEEFLADTQKSIFGSERASASSIEKSVKRRAHFIERSSADNEKNAFRR